MRNAFIFAAVFAFLFTSASALTIDVPQSVPQNTSWGFSISFDPTDQWNKTSVQVDGSLILDVHSNGTISADPYNGQFVLKYFLYDNDPSSTSGLVLYVSHFGLQNGGHEISAASENSSDLADVFAFAPLTDSDKGNIDSQITSLNQRAAGHDADINSLGSRINRASLDSNRAIAQSLKPLEEKIRGLESEHKKLSASLLAQQTKEQPSSGLVDLVSGMAVPFGFALLVIVGILLALGAVLLVKSKLSARQSVYSGKDEYNLPVSKEDEEMAGDLAEGGKWKTKKM